MCVYLALKYYRLALLSGEIKMDVIEIKEGSTMQGFFLAEGETV